MEDKEKYLKALEISLEMWEWLFENPDKSRVDWPGFLENKSFLSVCMCAICTYRYSREKELCFFCTRQEGKESHCAFVDFCYTKQIDELSRFHREWDTENTTTRKAFASDAVEAIKKEIERVKNNMRG